MASPRLRRPDGAAASSTWLSYFGRGAVRGQSVELDSTILDSTYWTVRSAHIHTYSNTHTYMRHGGKPFSTARECPSSQVELNSYLTHGTRNELVGSWKLKISAQTARFLSQLRCGGTSFTFSVSGNQCGPLGRTESSSAGAPRPLRRQHPVSTFTLFEVWPEHLTSAIARVEKSRRGRCGRCVL